MELPQSRQYGTKGREATQDFLSLYSHSTANQQDPKPPSQGDFLKTHDFLGKTCSNEESKNETSAVEKPSSQMSDQMVERILPGGIGTYSVSHGSYFNQRVPKPEGGIFGIAQGSSSDKNEETSNCSSYTGSGFSLWEEPAVKKGKTGKENGSTADGSTVREPAAVNIGQWIPERPSQSSSNNNNHLNSFTSPSSIQPSRKKSQGFIEMMNSAKDSAFGEETDDGEEFAFKKESPVSVTPLVGELRVKVDGKSHDQKANTPRSKHSATEQRRRSKINERFQKLREIIPHTDQKRDKASFLSEVIEYIQFLQEKVNKYEVSYQEWNQEAAKSMSWRNNQMPGKSFVDQTRLSTSGSGPALLIAANLEEKNVHVPPAVPESAHNPGQSALNSASTFKAFDHHSGPSNKALPFPMSVQPKVSTPVGGGATAQVSTRLASSSADYRASQPQAHTRSSIIGNSVASMKQEDMTIEGGTINISSVYSQGLLNTLTNALQSSGVDLSQASISVQVQLGKKENGRLNVANPIIKDNGLSSKTQGTTRSRDANCEESDQPSKKTKHGNK